MYALQLLKGTLSKNKIIASDLVLIKIKFMDVSLQDTGSRNNKYPFTQVIQNYQLSLF